MAGIPEYWIVDVNARRLIVHRQPTVGGFASVQEFGERESVTPLASPGASLPVTDLLP